MFCKQKLRDRKANACIHGKKGKGKTWCLINAIVLIGFRRENVDTNKMVQMEPRKRRTRGQEFVSVGPALL